MVSSEFGTPLEFFKGFDPAVANTEYGRSDTTRGREGGRRADALGLDSLDFTNEPWLAAELNAALRSG